MNTIKLFTAPQWCPPCKILEKNVISKLENQIDNNFIIEKYDIDAAENQELVEQYGIRSVPTMIFFKDDTEIHRVIGNVSMKDMTALLGKTFNTCDCNSNCKCKEN